MVPKTFLSRIAEKGPFVLYQGKLYQVDERIRRDYTDFVEFWGCRFGLVPSSEVGELEKLYQELNSQKIFEFKKEFIEDRLHQEIKTQEQMSQQIGKNRLLHFILYELFPLYLEESKDADLLLAGKDPNRQAARKKIDQLLHGAEDTKPTAPEQDLKKLQEELLRELKKEKAGRDPAPEEKSAKQREREKNEAQAVDLLLTHFYNLRDRGLRDHSALAYGQKDAQKKALPEIPAPKYKSLLMELLDGHPAVFFHGQAYALSPAQEGKEIIGTIRVSLEGTSFSAARFKPLEVLENNLAEKLALQFKIEALSEFESQLQEIKKLRDRNRNLEKLDLKNGLDLGSIGFLAHQGRYYVYFNVPKFAMKHPRKDIYYGFDPCRVGIELSVSESKVFGGSGVVIDAYSHPFLREEMKPFQTICNMTRGTSLVKLSEVEEVSRSLENARNVFLHGMTLQSFAMHDGTDVHDSRYYNKILAEKLKGREMTLAEVKSKGYAVTNQLWKYVDKFQK